MQLFALIGSHFSGGPVQLVSPLIYALLTDLILVLFMFWLYRPVLRGPFVFDDLAVLHNTRLLRMAHLRDSSDPPNYYIFIRPCALWHSLINVGWGHLWVHLRSYLSCRPLTNLTYELDARAGGLNPLRYHQTSLLIGMLAVISARHVVLSLVGSTWISLVVALLFAAHPMMTMGVGYIAGRSSLLCLMFSLLVVECFLVGGWIALGVIPFATLALLSKEEAITLIPLLGAMWMLGIGGRL